MTLEERLDNLRRAFYKLAKTSGGSETTRVSLMKRKLEEARKLVDLLPNSSGAVVNQWMIRVDSMENKFRAISRRSRSPLRRHSPDSHRSVTSNRRTSAWDRVSRSPLRRRSPDSRNHSSSDHRSRSPFRRPSTDRHTSPDRRLSRVLHPRVLQPIVSQVYSRQDLNLYCFYCGEPGHFKRECPTLTENINNSRCYSCGKFGHYAAFCSHYY